MKCTGIIFVLFHTVPFDMLALLFCAFYIKSQKVFIQFLGKPAILKSLKSIDWHLKHKVNVLQLKSRRTSTDSESRTDIQERAGFEAVPDGLLKCPWGRCTVPLLKYLQKVLFSRSRKVPYKNSPFSRTCRVVWHLHLMCSSAKPISECLVEIEWMTEWVAMLYVSQKRVVFPPLKNTHSVRALLLRPVLEHNPLRCPP